MYQREAPPELLRARVRVFEELGLDDVWERYARMSGGSARSFYRCRTFLYWRECAASGRSGWLARSPMGLYSLNSYHAVMSGGPGKWLPGLRGRPPTSDRRRLHPAIC
jgi:hypothetical protein